MDYLIHVANVLLFLSFAVADMLWLRALQVAASGALLGYFAFHELYAPVGWNVVFAALNGYHLIRVYRERRPVALTGETRDLYLRVFQTIRPRAFLSLIGQGEWREAEEGTQMVQAGEQLRQLLLIADGRVAVRIDGKEVSRMGPGSFVGEMSYITGQRATASIDALSRVRYIAWNHGELSDFLDEQPELRSAMQLVIGSDLVGKLRAVRSAFDMSLVRTPGGDLSIDRVHREIDDSGSGDI